MEASIVCKRTISNLLCISILFTALVAPSYAINNYDSLYSSSETSYCIEFDDGINFYSPAVKSNLEAISQELKEVVFSIDAGDDIFTIGYYLGDDPFSMTKISQELEKTLDNIRDDIITDERLSSNNQVSADNMELEYVVIDTTDSISKIISKLSGATSANQFVDSIEEYQNHNTMKSNVAKSATIDGSYHDRDIFREQHDIGWYNQSTGKFSVCTVTPTSPHSGDGNNRYESGYQWFPDLVDANFYTNVTATENRTKLWYYYYPDTLKNLNVDSNEALEMEVVFYNYTSATTSASNKGSAFQYIKSGSTWATNQPNSYRDTSFADNPNEVSFCVGVSDTSDLVANKGYYWYIDGTKGTTDNNYRHDGRFRVVAQRGYRLIGSGAFSVFAEEHEGIRRLGINDDQNWVPEGTTAWTLAASDSTWHFKASTDPVSN